MKNTDIKVTIVIPVYNAEKYLEKCIDSVLNQTYKSIEVVLIDDGSTDSSFSICNQAALRDCRVSAYHQQNKGVSATRNIGIEKATGEYVQFVDSDDWLAPKMTEILVKSIINNNVDFVCCGYNMVSKNKIKKIVPLKGCYTFQEYISQLKYWTIDIIIGSPYTKIFNREILQKNGIRYKEGLNFAEDYLFNMQYLGFVNTIALEDKGLYFYNLNTEGSLHQLNSKYLGSEDTWRTELLIIDSINEMLKRKNFQDGGRSFEALMFMYFLTSNCVFKSMVLNKQELLNWIYKISSNSQYNSYINQIEKIHRQPRINIASKIIRNIANHRLVNISYYLLKLIYAI